jgi:hypothetical protein
MGYVAYAFILLMIVSLAMLGYTQMKFGESAATQKQVKITLPEYTDYHSEFNDILAEFTSSYKIEQVKTTNLGSLLEVTFAITEKDSAQQKLFLDKLREVNGNLPIVIQSNKLGLNDL